MKDYGDMLIYISALPLAREKLDIAVVLNSYANDATEELNGVPGWGHSDL